MTMRALMRLVLPVVTVESYDRLGRLVRQRREFGAQIPQSFPYRLVDETGGYELSLRIRC